MTDERRHEGFTPGPWSVERGKSGQVPIVAAADGRFVLGGFAVGAERTWEECLANANLAADAPRLLAENAELRQRQAKLVEALTEAERRLRALGDKDESTITLIRAALAAARGEG